MRFSSTFVASSIFLSGLCAATPFTKRSTCTPNFQGRPVSVVNPPTGEWTPTQLKANYYLTTELGFNTTGEFRVEQDGQSPTGVNGHRAEYVPANNLTVSAITGSLRLEVYNATDSTQNFQITCQTCGSGDNVNALGCSIESTAFGVCVESTGTGGGPFITPCNASAENQYWDIIGADQ